MIAEAEYLVNERGLKCVSACYTKEYGGSVCGTHGDGVRAVRVPAKDGGGFGCRTDEKPARMRARALGVPL